jgi:hypothetical protein
MEDEWEENPDILKVQMYERSMEEEPITERFVGSWWGYQDLEYENELSNDRARDYDGDVDYAYDGGFFHCSDGPI